MDLLNFIQGQKRKISYHRERYGPLTKMVRTRVILLCIIHHRNCHNLNSKLNTTSTTTELDDPQLVDYFSSKILKIDRDQNLAE